MRRAKKIALSASSILMGLVLLRFALSKLLGEEESVNQFIEMAKPIGIDPVLFRMFTGFVILIVAVLYLVNAGFVIGKIKLPTHFDKAYLLGTLTMLGALMSEFFLRVNPKYSLVVLASIIIVFSLVDFSFLLKEKK